MTQVDQRTRKLFVGNITRTHTLTYTQFFDTTTFYWFFWLGKQPQHRQKDSSTFSRLDTGGLPKNNGQIFFGGTLKKAY